MQKISLILASDFTAVNIYLWELELIYKTLSFDVICFKCVIVLFLLPFLEV